jgi:hypothetical protein
MKKLIGRYVVLSVLLLSGIITLAGSSPAMGSTYDLSADWGKIPSVWAYGAGWDKESTDNPGSWAAGDVVVSLNPWPDYSMITWTCPTDGTISITGAAWYVNGGSDSIWLQLVPASLAGSLNFTNAHDTALQSGTTNLANGAVQSGYSSFTSKSGFGTSDSIPLRDVTSLSNLSVQAGDVIVVLAGNAYMFDGSHAGVELTINETPSNPVPVPSALILLGSGLIGLAGYRRKKH